MRHDFVRVFRMVTCAGLVALLAARIGHIPVSKLVFFLALVLVWFIATLLLTRSQEVSRTILRHAGLVGAVDGYLVLVVAAVALRAVWHMPLLLLGAYVFLAALAGGLGQRLRHRAGAAAGHSMDERPRRLERRGAELSDRPRPTLLGLPGSSERADQRFMVPGSTASLATAERDTMRCNRDV